MNLRRVVGRLALIATLMLGQHGIADAGGAVDLLPDIRVARLYGFSLERTSTGRVRLHFGTIGWNIGDGPMEARGRRIDPEDLVMRVWQRIYRSDGTHRDRNTSAVMIYETGDHHDHWHTRQFMTVKMFERGKPNGNVWGLRKLGYCLLDATRMPEPPPGSPDERSYPNGSCGNRSSQIVRSGLSIGYGDDYPPDYAHQWMDVTDIPVGVYRICTTVDPLSEFVEKKEANNQRWTDIRVNLATMRVKVLDTAVGRCGLNPP